MNIESNIPIPEPGSRRGHSKYERVLSAMEVGNSVLFQADNLAHAFRYAGFHYGYRMSVRKCADGWRVWRAA